MMPFDWMKEEMHTFSNALTFYTRIPSPLPHSFSEKRQARCTQYLPMIGWLIGGLGALIFWGAHFVFPMPVALALSMVATIWLTGAMHEDGFADVCDGFGGGWTKERILQIMKDPRLGTYGALGLWSILFLKWLCLHEISDRDLYITLIAGHGLSRSFSSAFILAYDYVGGGTASKSQLLCSRMSKSGFAFSALTGILPLALFREAGIFLCLIPMFLLHWTLGSAWKKKIGGYTGDCLGAAQQISELAFYLFILGWSWTSI